MCRKRILCDAKLPEGHGLLDVECKPSNTAIQNLSTAGMTTRRRPKRAAQHSWQQDASRGEREMLLVGSTLYDNAAPALL